MSDFGRRYYSATLGRWINRDPIGDLGGANVYAYVANNPTNRVDYLGLKAVVCPYLDTDPSRCGPQGETPPDGSAGHTGGPEENDKKPCPKRPEGGKGNPDEPTPPGEPDTPPDFCDEFCSQYSDQYENTACRAGCDAGRHGLPINPTCKIMGSLYGAKAKEACKRGHKKGRRPLPPAPFRPFGPNCSRGDCMTAVGGAGTACEFACLTGCALTGPAYGYCVLGCTAGCAGGSLYTFIVDCLRCPNP